MTELVTLQLIFNYTLKNVLKIKKNSLKFLKIVPKLRNYNIILHDMYYTSKIRNFVTFHIILSNKNIN